MPHTNYKKRSSHLVAFLLAIVFILSSFFSVFAVTHAASDNHLAQGNNQPTFPGPGNNQPTVSGPGKGSKEVSLINPLKFDSFQEFFKALIEIIIIFAIPIIVLMIIYAGFLYVMARGSEEQVTKATRALTYAVIGGLLILGAELFLTVIAGTVNQLTI